MSFTRSSSTSVPAASRGLRRRLTGAGVALALSVAVAGSATSAAHADTVSARAGGQGVERLGEARGKVQPVSAKQKRQLRRHAGAAPKRSAGTRKQSRYGFDGCVLFTSGWEVCAAYTNVYGVMIVGQYAPNGGLYKAFYVYESSWILWLYTL